VITIDERGVDAGAAASGDAANAHDQPTPRGARGPGLVCATAALSTMAAGWMAAGAFSGSLARAIAIGASIAGPILVALSFRTRRPSVVQHLALPLALVLGALVVVSSAGRSGSLPGLIAEAIRSGGLSQPPVAFDPGWRFVLVVSLVLLGSASAGIAIALDRPKLAVAIPLPVLVAAALAQPTGGEAVSALGAVVFGVLGLTLAFGEDLGRDTPTSRGFEVRRIGRGIAATAGVVAALGVLSQVGGVLLPKPRDNQVVPPQRPATPPRLPDQQLFTVAADRPLTWRLGVLDVYDSGAWKTPPFDPARFEPAPRRSGAMHFEFRVTGLSGRVLPVPPGLTGVRGTAAELDPRTGVVRRPSGRVSQGLTYRADAAAPPTGDQLSAAPAPDPRMRPFLVAPTPPAPVQAILDAAPSAPAFARLQFVRQAFYDKVVAAGAGRPVDVSAARVGRIVEGAEATPYEIAAAEALMARWAGVPARIGYGYYGGAAGGGVFEVRPRNGATWLEAYFEGVGWVPLVGVPPRAKGSLSNADKKSDPAVRPTDELAVVTYVPVRLDDLRQLSTVVRFWLARALVVVVALLAALAMLPEAWRMLRRRRRSRWAKLHGPLGRIAVAYAELRDATTDLGLGTGNSTPLELAAAVEGDDEHRELAWLVTRALWGDLSRDATNDDADAAEALARSVSRRLALAQPFTSRAVAAISRASLRDPYTPDLPGLDAPPARIVGLGATTGALLLAGIATALALSGRPEAPRAVATPPAVPAAVGDLTLQREPAAEVAFSKARANALVRDGAVYTLRRGVSVEASLQVARLVPSALTRRDDVRDGVLESIGNGRFQPVRLGDERGYRLDLPEQRMLLWFAPDGASYELLVGRRAFAAEAEGTFSRLLAAQRTSRRAGDRIVDSPEVPIPDPRRGGNS